MPCFIVLPCWGGELCLFWGEGILEDYLVALWVCGMVDFYIAVMLQQ